MLAQVPDGAPARVREGEVPPASEDTKFSYLWACRAWLDQVGGWVGQLACRDHFGESHWGFADTLPSVSLAASQYAGSTPIAMSGKAEGWAWASACWSGGRDWEGD